MLLTDNADAVRYKTPAGVATRTCNVRERENEEEEKVGY